MLRLYRLAIVAIILVLLLLAIATVKYSSGHTSRWGSAVSSNIIPYRHLRSSDGINLPPPVIPEAHHLVIVAGHAIWSGNGLSKDRLGIGESAEEWVLKDFQKGQQSTYLKHIEAGVHEAEIDSSSVLIFTGGQTSKEAGPISEAQSYYSLAQARSLYSSRLRDRVTTEEFARDSLENLLFSVCRFHEFTGSYPSNITVVSHNFKRSRFRELHAKALGIPLDKFFFRGIDPPGEIPAEAERVNAIIPFSQDPHGCFNEILLQKRRDRNPFRRRHPYLETCPELHDLLSACNTDGHALKGNLPWGTLAA